MVKIIYLTQNKHTIVDDEDFTELNNYKWSADRGRNTYYAVRVEKNKKIYMHRIIMQSFFTPERNYTDHRNKKGLDNRKCNLRVCNNAENMSNCWKKHNTSGLRGVTWNKEKKKWTAQIIHNYKHIHLGHFEDKIQAGKAYDKKAYEFFGNFAMLNFSGGD